MELGRARWRKSSFSGNNGGNCVEVAELAVGRRPEGEAGGAVVVAVRDSKCPDGPKAFFAPTAWNAFLEGLSAGELDR